MDNKKYEHPNRNQIAVDIIRIVNFLRNNQLIQANGVSQKLEAIILDMVMKDVAEAKERPEFHILWPIFHRVNRIQSLCLSGKTGLALKEGEDAAKIMSKI